VDLPGFFAVAAIVVVTPGPDMALVMRNTIAGGRSAGLVTSLGTCSGLLVHATAAALGLSAILLASSRAFTVVKLAGAAYLVGLGLVALLRSRAAEPETPSSASRRISAWTAYRQGVLTNVLNPKVAVFFLSLLPQFVEPGEGSTVRLLLLASLFIALGLAWLTTYTLALDALGGVLSRARVRRAIERLTGAVLVALGVRLAFARR
jgi:threonine/homoserine/homoserine lactone efflux protein